MNPGHGETRSASGREKENRIDELTVANGQPAAEIPEHMRAEERLMFQANLLANISDVVYATDLQLRMTSWNRAAETLFGWQEKDVLGKSILEVVGPKAAPEYRAVLTRELLDKGPVKARIEHSIGNNDTVVFESLTMLLRDSAGKVIGFVGVNRDVTERDRALDALRESQHRSGAILNASSESIWLMSLSGDILAANPTAARRLGTTVEEIVGKNCFGLLPPDVGKFRKAKIEEMAATGEAVRFEDERAGIVFDHTFYPARDTHGKITGLAIFSRDVTERKRAEEKIAFQAQVLSQVHDAVLALDKDYVITYWNNFAEQMYGFKAKEAIGRKSFDLFHTTYLGSTMEEVAAKIRSFGKFAYMAIHHTKDGRDLAVDVHSSVQCDLQGNPIGYISSCRDITKRKRAEEALQESEKRYRHLVRYAPAGIYEVDFPSGRFSEVNEAMCRILGYTQEELLGMNAFDVLDSEGQARFISRINRAQSGDKPEEAVEYRVRTKDGRFIWALLNTTFRRKDGKFVGATVVAHDISERKAGEEKLQTTLQRFYRILSGMHFGILLVTDDNKVEFTNQAFCDIFGMKDSPESLVDLSADEMIERIRKSYAAPDQAIKRIRDIVAAEQPVRAEEIQMSEYRFFLRDFIPIRVGNQRSGRLWIHMEITERKKAEDKIQQTSEELRRTNEDLTRFNRVAVDRELRMIEMKKEINDLCQKLGEPVRYEMGLIKGNR
jgi:PAS domain S-box-containing protein